MNDETPTNSRRRTTMLAIAGALAATVLVLGVNGTLSSWTSAVVTNDTNTAGAEGAVALSESDGTSTCDTVTTSDNTFTCSTINKYGGDTAMAPGNSSVVTVTFTNDGSADGKTFGYAPGTCSSTPGPGGTDLCADADADLTVAVVCSTGTSYDAANDIAGLGQAAVAPGSLAGMSVTGAPELATGDSITCQFTTTLASDAKTSDAASQVSQPIVWTLGA